jgi:hypothetical protein
MLTVLLLSACTGRLSVDEAREALAAFVANARADAMVGGVVEITTGFTVGAGVEESATRLRDFVESQLPCSTVTREGATVTIDFGTLDDACTWNGATWAGVAEVEVVALDDGAAVQLHHAWSGLTNGTDTLDGEAEVTWDLAAGTREVVHTATWSDGETLVTGEGARTQSLLDPAAGIAGGLVVVGSRSWTVDGALWQLGIDSIEVRPQDPVPQAGTLRISTPAGKEATLLFERQDADTIRVTIEGARREVVVDVTGTSVVPVEE